MTAFYIAKAPTCFSEVLSNHSYQATAKYLMIIKNHQLLTN
jgi:hypothetical protein